MISQHRTVAREDFETQTGWKLEPQGACKAGACIPLPQSAQPDAAGRVDLEVLAGAMQLPLVHDERQGLWALGPESLGGRALLSAEAPDFELPDLEGNALRLSSLRGQKIVVYAWAPY